MTKSIAKRGQNAILVGTTGRFVFLGLTKTIIKSLANTKVKTQNILDGVGPKDDND